MRRSAILLAGKTLVVSLPKQWVDMHGIRKGQELEILPLGKKLVISPSSPSQKREMSLSQKDSLWFTADALSYLYQLGIDEARISYDSSATLRKLSSKISNLLGFEIVEQRAGTVTVKNVATPLEEEYGALLRRSFFVVQEMGQLLLRHASRRDLHDLEISEEIIALDGTLNKLTDFCKRATNRSEMHSTIHSTVQYTVVRDLEKLGDEIRYASVSMRDGPLPSAAVLQLIRSFNLLFEIFHELFYGFEDQKAAKFHEAAAALIVKALSLLKIPARKQDALIAHHMLNVGVLLKDLFGPLYLGVLSRQSASENEKPGR